MTKTKRGVDMGNKTKKKTTGIEKPKIVIPLQPINSAEIKALEEITIEDELFNAIRDGTISAAEFDQICSQNSLDEKGRAEIIDMLQEMGVSIVSDDNITAQFQDDEMPSNNDDYDEDDEKEYDPLEEMNDEEILKQIVYEGDLQGLIIKDMTQMPLLTADQEVTLAKAIEAGKTAKSILNNLTNLTLDKLIEEMDSKFKLKRKPRTRAEAEVMLKKIFDEGVKARETLIMSNTRLVISVARKYIGRGVGFVDLIQEGNIGLMRAVNKFDWKRGNKFSTYATWWIRQAITRAIADHGRIIRLPVHMNDTVARVHRISHQLRQELGREPTIEELADKLSLSPTKVRQILGASKHVVSLDESLSDEEDSNSLGDLIPDLTSANPDIHVESSDLSNTIAQMLRVLTPREQKLIIMRYGLNGDKEMSLEEIGKKMGITRERVRQIEAQALRKLRSSPNMRELFPYKGYFNYK
ncbi:MAG: sigma-70 family RNA polymerase sigma factor [Methylacidiphilales bacterium]|nr:sigma-70 family RNA polymerase sigma factor [Candidatus Methylacidiphilales bacterium]